jgi:hypothetical protein
VRWSPIAKVIDSQALPGVTRNAKRCERADGVREIVKIVISQSPIPARELTHSSNNHHLLASGTGFASVVCERLAAPRKV